MTSRLMKQYKEKAIPALQNEFNIANVMAVPKISKVVINSGVGRMVKDAKAVEKAVRDLGQLTGQKPSLRKAKKSIASFKLREGATVGLMTTLRGKRMYDFLDRLISIALPMSRDFRGIDPKNIDQHGNLNLGIKEHNIFPEVSYESLKDIFGLQVTIVTTSKSREQALSLFKQLGVPLKH